MTFPIGYAMANKTVFAEVDKYPNVKLNIILAWLCLLEWYFQTFCICCLHLYLQLTSTSHNASCMVTRYYINLRDPAHSVSIFSCSVFWSVPYLLQWYFWSTFQDFDYLCAHTSFFPNSRACKCIYQHIYSCKFQVTGICNSNKGVGTYM